ncbi:8357_t:CDS:2 [Cetraspora pellucida]|uniref:8357_t:CDS:1 n=1 Tax=Cetraspora pellucida TaxID=1433469 RepID=A0ACA9LCJ2_9GLOM|nr:8357_t:CDS:2 [Cetraspora pellucida]
MDLNYSKNNVDITEYFEESYNKDVSDITNNIESLSLKEGDSFDDFDKAEAYIHRFSDSKGKFVNEQFSVNIQGNDDFRIFVITLNDNHNHDLLPEAIQFEKDKQFTEEMREEINFFVTKCHLGATIDLYVEIQQCQPSCSAIKCNASQFYEQLLSKQHEDSRWFVEVMWEEETNTLINLFWMSPEQIMLWCEFNEAVGHDNT